MPDPAAEIRLAVERVIQWVTDNQQAQRGWDAGYHAAAGALLGTSVPVMGSDSDLAIDFSTGYDATTGTTVTGFTLDFSALDGPDELL